MLIRGKQDRLGNIKNIKLIIGYDKKSTTEILDVLISVQLYSYSTLNEIADLIKRSVRLPSPNSVLCKKIIIQEGQYEAYILQPNREPKEVSQKFASLQVEVGPEETYFVPILDDEHSICPVPKINYSTSNNYNKLVNFFEGVVRYLELAKNSTMLTFDLKQFNNPKST